MGLAMAKVPVVILAVIISFASLVIYGFGFSKDAFSAESLFWAAPLLCPVAALIYVRSKIVGACIQLILFSGALCGVYVMQDHVCRTDDCAWKSPAVSVIASSLSDPHILLMLALTLWLCVGAISRMRNRSPAADSGNSVA